MKDGKINTNMAKDGWMKLYFQELKENMESMLVLLNGIT